VDNSAFTVYIVYAYLSTSFTPPVYIVYGWCLHRLLLHIPNCRYRITDIEFRYGRLPVENRKKTARILERAHGENLKVSNALRNAAKKLIAP
jgi:hypothetical protein